MQEKLRNKTEIHLDQLKVGALLKFEKLDNVDIRMLIDDFAENKTIELRMYSRINTFFRHIYVRTDGTIELNPLYSLNSIFDDSDYTIFNKFKEFAGPIVNEYINSLNLENFKIKKEKILTEQKDTILNNVEVLLISDNEEDYKGLIDYGFQKVDYFKSIIRADRYFENRFDELNKYKIILIGSQSVNCCLGGSYRIRKPY